MRITTKRQVTIFIEPRKKTGFLPHTGVAFEWDGRVLKILPASSPSRSSRGDRLLAHLKGSATIKMTTDQILALTRDR